MTDNTLSLNADRLSRCTGIKFEILSIDVELNLPQKCGRLTLWRWGFDLFCNPWTQRGNLNARRLNGRYRIGQIDEGCEQAAREVVREENVQNLRMTTSLKFRNKCSLRAGADVRRIGNRKMRRGEIDISASSPVSLYRQRNVALGASVPEDPSSGLDIENTINSHGLPSARVARKKIVCNSPTN